MEEPQRTGPSYPDKENVRSVWIDIAIIEKVRLLLKKQQEEKQTGSKNE